MSFVNDTFTGSDSTLLENHTGETGASWTKHPSYSKSTVINSNRIRAGSADTNFTVYYASGTPAGADYDVEGVVVRITSASTDFVGSDFQLPEPLPRELAQGARAAMVERPPTEAEIPLEELAAAPFPKLVVSGGHNAAFDAICDVLEQRLGAERAVLPGAGHSLPRAPGYLERLEAFLGVAERAYGKR